VLQTILEGRDVIPIEQKGIEGEHLIEFGEKLLPAYMSLVLIPIQIVDMDSRDAGSRRKLLGEIGFARFRTADDENPLPDIVPWSEKVPGSLKLKQMIKNL